MASPRTGTGPVQRNAPPVFARGLERVYRGEPRSDRRRGPAHGATTGRAYDRGGNMRREAERGPSRGHDRGAEGETIRGQRGVSRTGGWARRIHGRGERGGRGVWAAIPIRSRPEARRPEPRHERGPGAGPRGAYSVSYEMEFAPRHRERDAIVYQEESEPTYRERYRLVYDEDYGHVYRKKYGRAPWKGYKTAYSRRYEITPRERYGAARREEYKIARRKGHDIGVDEGYESGVERRYRSVPDLRSVPGYGYEYEIGYLYGPEYGRPRPPARHLASFGRRPAASTPAPDFTGRERRKGERRGRDRRRGERRRGDRRGGWNARPTVPASTLPRGRPAVERWWRAIGPEPRSDYDWAYRSGPPERYGWTGEASGRGGGGRRG